MTDLSHIYAIKDIEVWLSQ